MKKKVLVLLAIFAIIGSVVSAQVVNASVYNQVYSETAMRNASPEASMMFWGIRNRSWANITAERWRVQARYDFRFTTMDGVYGTNTTSGQPGAHGSSGNGAYSGDTSLVPNGGWQANFWLTPIKGFTFIAGNDHVEDIIGGVAALRGAGMGVLLSRSAFYGNSGANGFFWGSVAYGRPNNGGFSGNPAGTPTGINGEPWDGNQVWVPGISNGDGFFNPNEGFTRFARNGASLVVEAIPNLKLAVNLPVEQKIVENHELKMRVNMAAKYNILNMIDVAAIWHGGFDPDARDTSGFGVYADFVGVKNLVIQAGFSGQFNPGKAWGRVNGGWGDITGIGAIVQHYHFAGDQARNRNGGQNVTYEVADDADAIERPTNGAVRNMDSTLATAIDLAASLRLNNGMSIAAAGEIGMGWDYAFPMLIGLRYDWNNIFSTLNFSTTVTWGQVSYINKNNVLGYNVAANYGQFFINPNFTYTIGQNEFSLGAIVDINYYNYSDSYVGENEGAFAPNYSHAYIGFRLPVYWRYYF